MQTGSYNTVLVDKEDQITTVTLNRPDKKNAMNPELHNEMIDVMTKLEDDDDTRVVILTGAGDSFCAGQDLKQFFLEKVDKPMDRRRTSRLSQAWGKRLRTLPKPTIAQVNGWCFGGGLRIMCLCDFAIASEKAIFGLSEINFATIPSTGAMWAPAYHLHPRDALYLAMTGERIDAHEADRMRLINKVVSHDQLREEVLKLARILKEKDPVALMECKETFRLARRLDYDDSMEWEAAKSHEKSYLQGGLWVKALSGFADKKFKPGLETFKKEEPK